MVLQGNTEVAYIGMLICIGCGYATLVQGEELDQ